MANTEETYAPDEPQPFEWAGVEMWRCPFDRCGWSNEDRDVIVDHLILTGHVGPDAPTQEEPTTEEQTPDKSGARKGGK